MSSTSTSRPGSDGAGGAIAGAIRQAVDTACRAQGLSTAVCECVFGKIAPGGQVGPRQLQGLVQKLVDAARECRGAG